MKRILAKLLPESIKNLIRTILFGKQVEEANLVYKLFQHSSGEKLLVDVGAHFGNTLLPFAKSGWEVLAFEPDPENRKKLHETIRANNLMKVRVDQRALAEKPGKLNFFKSEVSTGISSLVSFHKSHKPVGEIDVTTLDLAITEYKLSNITFLKTDTEGYDLMVLQGLDFDNIAPLAIICEFENAKTKKLGYTVNDQVDFLKSKGYQLVISEWYPIVEYGRRHKWKQYSTDVDKLDPDSWGNIIAVQKAHYQQLLQLCKIA